MFLGRHTCGTLQGPGYSLAILMIIEGQDHVQATYYLLSKCCCTC